MRKGLVTIVSARGWLARSDGSGSSCTDGTRRWAQGAHWWLLLTDAKPTCDLVVEEVESV